MTLPDRSAPRRSRRYRVLDLFCGAGGTGMGFHRVGFEVVGVDIRPQPRYPFEFHRADAMTFPLDGFDLVVAGPPCQRFSSITRVAGRVDDHPDLIGETRERLRASGLPYVIENVPRAPLVDPVLICAAALGLRLGPYVLRRHRLFESNVELHGTGCGCRRGDGITMGVYGGGTRQHTRRGKTTGGDTDKATLAQARALMGMPWATRVEMAQAIPPAYTELLARQLVTVLDPSLVDTRRAA